MIERHGQDLPIASCRHDVAEAAWVNVPDVLSCGLSDLNADGSGRVISRKTHISIGPVFGGQVKGMKAISSYVESTSYRHPCAVCYWGRVFRLPEPEVAGSSSLRCVMSTIFNPKQRGAPAAAV